MKRKLSDLLDEYRRGDDEARTELMEHIEKLLLPLVRKFMSSRLRLDRESIDVCQSLLMDLHTRAEQGTLDLESEQALRGYVRAMVRHKLANLADRMNAARRGGKATRASLNDSDPQAPSSIASPSLLTYAAEIHSRLREELSREEFAILEGRISGRTNSEIADEMGKSADAVRMTWARARDRLVQRGIVDGPGPGPAQKKNGTGTEDAGDPPSGEPDRLFIARRASPAQSPVPFPPAGRPHSHSSDAANPGSAFP